MKAAQIALAFLTGALIAAAAAMFITEHDVPAWVFTAFGLLGFISLLGMIVTDANPGRRLPPPR